MSSKLCYILLNLKKQLHIFTLISLFQIPITLFQATFLVTSFQVLWQHFLTFPSFLLLFLPLSHLLYLLWQHFLPFLFIVLFLLSLRHLNSVLPATQSDIPFNYVVFTFSLMPYFKPSNNTFWPLLYMCCFSFISVAIFLLMLTSIASNKRLEFQLI
jgi:hypothetical protein